MRCLSSFTNRSPSRATQADRRTENLSMFVMTVRRAAMHCCLRALCNISSPSPKNLSVVVACEKCVLLELPLYRYEPRCSGLLRRGWSLPKLQPNSCVRVVHLFCTHSPSAAASSHSSFCDSRRDGGHVPHGSPFDYSSACLEAMGQIHSDSGPNQPEHTEGNESKFSYMHNIPPGEGTVQGTICADK